MGNVIIPLEIFSGPCVLESEILSLNIAETLKNDFSNLIDQGRLVYTFKGSFDKANRTSIDSDRGPGLEEGLRILEKVKKEFELPVVTDFHLPSQAQAVAQVVDVLQVPAFLCRQTDMIVEGAKACKKYGRRLKIKKGQFLSPYDVKNIIEKAANFIDRKDILLTERGTSFGYNNMIVDMASFDIMKSFGVKTVHDATHCVQRPGGLGKQTGGKREQILVLARAALAAGADALFMECHPDPDKAMSDATTSLRLDKMKDIVQNLIGFYELASKE